MDSYPTQNQYKVKNNVFLLYSISMWDGAETQVFTGGGAGGGGGEGKMSCYMSSSWVSLTA